jgi:hypothetical protein
MTSITNLFSNFNGLTKTNPTTYNLTSYKKNNLGNGLSSLTPALTQGDKFKKYQKKIKKNLEKRVNINNLSGKEGFTGLNLENMNLEKNGLAIESNNIITSNETAAEQQHSTLVNLRQQYEDTLQQYNTLVAQFTTMSSNYVKRTSASNPYLGKNIRFSNGYIFYVTNQGVAKFYPDGNVYSSVNGINGCPASGYVDIDIPWNDSYRNQGTLIPTTPELLVGTPMVAGQSCGNEGRNVYVNALTANVSTSYVGCYNDNITSPLMTFIGGSPPPSILTNGNFEQPQLQNDSYTYYSAPYLSSALVWNFFAILINNSTAWGFPMPYPYGSQAAVIQGSLDTGYGGTFGQNFTLGSGAYTLSFSACGRPPAGANPININLGLFGGNTSELLYTFTPPATEWQTYSIPINSTTPGTYAMNFVGTQNSIYYSTAFQNIQITNSSSSAGGSYTYEQCQNKAINSGYKYFALQDVNTTNSMGYCAVSNDEPTITSLGQATVANNQITLWSSNTNNGTSVTLTSSGSLTIYNSSGTAVFSTPTNNVTPNSSYPDYILTLQDDGNVVIYQSNGTNVNPNIYGLWSTATNGKQQQPNPQYAAAKGKYGKNYLMSGQTLAVGDFVGSTSGSLALIMQTDGNLALYTFTAGSSCQKMSDGQMGGGVGANAIYGFNQVGIPSNIGQLAYVDANSYIYNYPDNNASYGNTYTEISQGMDTPGNDIPGAAYSNATVESCQTSCNNIPGCAGIVTNAAGNVCWPKTSSMYPYSTDLTTNPDRNIYVRNKTPVTLPIGVPDTITNIDSIQYQNYVNGGTLRGEYGLAYLTSVQQQQLEALTSQLELLAEQINSYTDTFNTNTESAEVQMNKNMKGLKGYITDLTVTDSKINKFGTQMDNILNDSDIVALQKNYDYLFWTILAAGTVLVAINLVRK